MAVIRGILDYTNRLHDRSSCDKCCVVRKVMACKDSELGVLQDSILNFNLG